ncbi:MAG TPA: STAS domain-containing protein [Acidimicrobiales bacterium]|nr:STAS domain-containing protein [Acidimicrobiales bacterium]
MRQRSVRRHHAPSPFHTPSALPRRVLLSPLEVRVDATAQGSTVLHPVGEIESATVPVFRQAVAEIGPDQRVIIDMAGVPFVDSCGIGALIGAVRRVRELGGTIAMAAVTNPVGRVLNLTGLDRIVEIAETVEQASDRLEAPDNGSRPKGDRIAI